MGNEQPDNDGLTVEQCVDFCNTNNFTLAGMEFGVQCCKFEINTHPAFRTRYNRLMLALVCDNNVIDGGTLAPEDSDCNMSCGGNAT